MASFLYNPYSNIITVEAPATEITVVELYNSIRDYEDTTEFMWVSKICDASGGEDLGGGVRVGYTLKLYDWKVKFEDRAGPSLISCKITGGNILSVDPNGNGQDVIEPSTYTFVTITSSSSATLQELTSIQHSSFNERVTLDITSPYNGTTFPVGTGLQPVNNLIDAKAIATLRGFNEIYVLGNYTFGVTDTLDGFLMRGQSEHQSNINLTNEALIENCIFEHSTVFGYLDGGCTIRHSHVTGGLNYVDGDIHNCELGLGTIVLNGLDAAFINCYSGVPGVDTPTIDMGGSGTKLSIRGYIGGIKLINHSGTDGISIDMLSGHIILDSTITNGIIITRGIAKLTDDSTGTTKVNSADLLIPARLTNLKFLIENLRPHHTGTGKNWYWSPFDGDDTLDGKSESTACKTFQHIHDNLARNWKHDIIHCVSTNPAGPTISTETISITKNLLFVRGPGFNFHIEPTVANASNALIDVKGSGVELSSLYIGGGNGPVGSDVICTTSNSIFFKDMWVVDGLNDGIIVDGGRGFELENVQVKNNANHGINFKDNCIQPIFHNTHVEENGGDGVHLEGTGIDELYLKGTNIIHGSGGYGLNIGAGVINTRIGEFTTFEVNALGDILDNGTGTGNQAIFKRNLQTDSILDSSLISHDVPNSLAVETKDARKIGTNKALIVDVGGGMHQISVYDDDNITILYEWTVSADKLIKTKL